MQVRNEQQDLKKKDWKVFRKDGLEKLRHSLTENQIPKFNSLTGRS